MLLGTITARIQSKPAVREMVKQTLIIPFPALLRDHNRQRGNGRVLGAGRATSPAAAWGLASFVSACLFLHNAKLASTL